MEKKKMIKRIIIVVIIASAIFSIGYRSCSNYRLAQYENAMAMERNKLYRVGLLGEGFYLVIAVTISYANGEVYIIDTIDRGPSSFFLTVSNMILNSLDNRIVDISYEMTPTDKTEEAFAEFNRAVGEFMDDGRMIETEEGLYWVVTSDLLPDLSYPMTLRHLETNEHSAFALRFEPAIGRAIERQRAGS